MQRDPSHLRDRPHKAVACAQCQKRNKVCGHTRPRDQGLPSCTECYRRKKRCNHGQPCSNCARRYPPVDCVYKHLTATESSNTLSIWPNDELQSFITPFPAWQAKSSSSLIRVPSPLSSVGGGKLNRVQLLAANSDFLSIDSMYIANKTLDNAQSLYMCLHQLINGNDALDAALQALCLAQLSNKQQDKRLREESLIMKGRALKKLSMSLSNTRTAHSLETLAASMCLKTYEELSYDPDTLEQINAGTKMLIRQRGPASFANSHAHIVFVRWFREYEIYHAIARETPTFLAEHDWCTLPWRDIEKTDEDKLIDIIAEYTIVRHQVTYLGDMETSSAGLLNAEAMFRSCRKLDKNLSIWFERFEKNNPDARLPAIPSKADLPSRLLFPLAYQFQNLYVAVQYLKYWATYMLLHGSLWRIDNFRKRVVADVNAGKAQSISNTATTLFPAFDYPRSIQYSRDICQSLDYVLSRTRKSSGPLYVTYPIVVAYFAFMFYPGCQAEAECLAEMMREMNFSGHGFTARYPEHMPNALLSLRQKGKRSQ